MGAEESVRAGDLPAALAQLQERVRNNPADARARIFLFQLLAVLGEWERALNQLNVIGELDAGALAMVHTYREALRCEVLRNEVFAGRRSPTVFGDPAGWLAQLIEALRLTGNGKFAAAQDLRGAAFDVAPASPGSVDGQAFDWMADADSRLGPVLEVIVGGRYYWVPFMRIRTLIVEEPADLRDCVWTPASFIWANGGETVGLIPTRYPGSHTSDDDAIRLARKTDWIEVAGNEYHGLGQRMLVTSEAELPLMDIRRVELATSDDTAAGPVQGGQ